MGSRTAHLVRVVPFGVLVFAFSLIAAAEEPQFQPDTVAPRIVQPVDEHQLTVLKGNTHRLARPEFDRGEAPRDLPMQRMLLVLKRSDDQERSLRKLLDDQQDKSSPNYHKWLTPETFGKQFGPADQDMQVLTSWLQSHGFQIGSVAKGRNMIEFSGTAAQVKEALHTSIHKYVVNGEEHWANSNDPQIPSALTPVVAGVHTLHNFLKKPMIHMSGEKVAGKYVPGKPPELTFSDGTHALGPADYGKIYNITPLYYQPYLILGSGILAVVARSNINTADYSQFTSYFPPAPGISAAPIPFIVLNGPDPGNLGGGEEAEAMLDLTWANATAPGINGGSLVISATTNTTDGVDLSELYIIDNNFADVMTESFSTCEGFVTQAQAEGIATLAQQAAAQGITYIVASGDSGAEGCDDPNNPPATHKPSVNVLASTPYTVAVGGTMFNESGQNSKYWKSSNSQDGFESALSYIPEDVWNESGQKAGLWAGGGGASTFFPKPSWQPLTLKGMPNDGKRDIPDVSLTAAGHDPYLICLEGSCTPDSQGNIFLYFVSGTSASTPSFAGIMALVHDKMKSRQGQADYVLYKLAATENFSQCNASNTSGLPASGCIFNDVTVGNNVVPGEQGNQYQSTVGYDLATGLGSVNVLNLVNKWNTATFKPTTTTVVSLSPTSITHGSPVSADITVTSSGGTPTGAVSLVTSDYPNQAVGPLSLTAGAFNGQIFTLPGGTHSFTAQYGGDGTFAPSGSTPPYGPITVTAEPSTTTLSVLGYPNQSGFPPFTSGPYGSFVYLRADVKGNSGYGTATGNVTFTDNGSNVTGDPYALNSQGNTATPNGLFTFAAGAHSIIANYNGDLSFNPSFSAPTSFTITPASTTATVTAQGTNLSATVNTTSGGIPPTGTVTFFVDGAQSGSPVSVTGTPATINPQTDAVTKGASATANLTVSKPPSKSFKATYNGDGNYVASTSPSTPDFSLAAGNSTVTVINPGAAGTETLTITAVNSFIGSVQFSSASCSGLPSESTCSFSPASITSSGTTTLTITTTAPKAAGLLRPGFGRPNSGRPAWWMEASATLFAGVLMLGVPSKKRRRTALLSLVLFTVMVLPSCGGGSSSSGTPPDPGTPVGTYTVTVRAASGSISHNVSFTLMVQ